MAKKIRVRQVEDIHTDETYLKEDLKITTKVGEVKACDDGKNYATISATKQNGEKKTVQEMLEEIFSKDNNPTVTAPSVSVAVSPNASLVEVGTKVAVKVTATFSPGSYSYGPATGVTAKTITAFLASKKSGESVENLTVQSGKQATFQEVMLNDGDEYSVGAIVQHTEGAVPKTQLGSDADGLAIAAGTVQTTANKKAVTAFRKYFYGVMTDTAALTSAKVRALTGSTKAAAAGTTFNITAGTSATKRMVVAAPKNAVSGITALLTTSMNADISANFVKQTVAVEGAEGYDAADYDVWVFQPDAFQGNEVVKITMN